MVHFKNKQDGENEAQREITQSLWSGTNKNRDVSTGQLARPFARSPAPLTRSLAPDCSLRSRPPLRSLVRSLPCSWDSEWLDGYLFCVCLFSGPLCADWFIDWLTSGDKFKNGLEWASFDDKLAGQEPKAPIVGFFTPGNQSFTLLFIH